MTSEIDPNYEYDAPQFVDFSEGLQQHDPDVDKWFGKFMHSNLNPLRMFKLNIKWTFF